MDEKLAIDEIKERAERLGVSMLSLCNDLGIDYTSLQRWKSKDPKSITTYRKLVGKLDELEQNGGANVTTATIPG